MGIQFGKHIKTLQDKIFPRAVKRKITDDHEKPQEKRRRLDPIPCDIEVYFTSAVNDGRSTPLSQRSGKRKASFGDESVESKKRKLDLLAMFTAKYQEKDKLGKGGYGCVFAGIRKADNLAVAIKHIPRNGVLRCKDNTGKSMPVEVSIMLKLTAETERPSAPIELLDWYDLDQELILVLERPMPSVDLHSYIRSKGGCLKENVAKVIMRQVVEAAIDLQQRSIFHRDIKAKNLLIETGIKKAPRVRVIDFGVSCCVAEGETFKDFKGTYFTPEWRSKQEYKAGPTTVFQIGVVLLEMVQDKSYGQKGIRFQRRINWSFSENCKNFYKSCTLMDPDRRLTLEQLRHHLWLK